MRNLRYRRWHLDEVFVKINGVKHYLWRAVDHEGEVLESFVTKRRDKKAALKFLRKSLGRNGLVEQIVTDRLASYGAALKQLGTIEKRETSRWLNSRAENSHQPFRRRERAMLWFRRMRTEGPRSEFCRNSPRFTARSTTNSFRGPSGQRGTSPFIQAYIQGTPHRRTHSVASTLRRLIHAGVGRFLRLFWFV